MSCVSCQPPDRPVAAEAAHNGWVPAALPSTSLRPTRLPRSRRVLLLVDFINPLDFPGADKLAAPAVSAARATAELKDRLALEGVPAIYANDNYGVWRSDFKAVWSRCRATRGAAAQIARLLKPRPDDLTILKPRHSAFYSTPLELLLRQLRCRKLVIAGLATDNCVLFTAMDAYLHGYSLWVPEDCTAAERDDAKTSALAHMRRVLKARTHASTALRKRAQGARAAPM